MTHISLHMTMDSLSIFLRYELNPHTSSKLQPYLKSLLKLKDEVDISSLRLPLATTHCSDTTQGSHIDLPLAYWSSSQVFT